MKIVQTFWTGNEDCRKDSYGWLSPTYNYLSWILSCNQLRKFHDDVILVTDKAGYEILIKQLHLPYTDTIVCLDELNCYNSNLWALAKIKTYSIMNEPFIHVDADVFTWDKFSDSLVNYDLIAQNIETATAYYRDMWESIRPAINYMPTPMIRYDQNIDNKAYNMGIFGGSDIAFIKEYCKASFDFVDKNIKEINDIKNVNFNIFFEQVLCYELASLKNKNVGTYINEDIGDNKYINFANFEDVPHKRTYLHLLGDYKRHPFVCNRMKAYVIKFYPEYYRRLEILLDLSPKLSDCGLDYSQEVIESAKMSYIKDLFNKKYGDSIPNERELICRDIITLSSTNDLSKRLVSGNNFQILSTSSYSIRDKFIEINQTFNEVLEINKLSIDNVIFAILSKNCDKETFNCKAIEYLDKDFPANERKRYITTLWERISQLTSLGIFISAYKKL